MKDVDAYYNSIVDFLEVPEESRKFPIILFVQHDDNKFCHDTYQCKDMEVAEKIKNAFYDKICIIIDNRKKPK